MWGVDFSGKHQPGTLGKGNLGSGEPADRSDHVALGFSEGSHLATLPVPEEGATGPA